MIAVVEFEFEVGKGAAGEELGTNTVMIYDSGKKITQSGMWLVRHQLSTITALSTNE